MLPRANKAARYAVFQTGFLLFAGCIFGSTTSPVALAQADSAAQPQVKNASVASAVTREFVDARIKEVEETKDLPEELKTKILDLYQNAIGDLKKVAESATRGTAFENLAKSAQTRQADTQAQLKRLGSSKNVEIPSATSIPDLEKALQQSELEFKERKQELDALDADRAHRQTRRTEIPGSTTTIRQRLAEIDRELATPAPTGELPLLTTAIQTRRRAERQLLDQELAANDRELAAYASESTEFRNAQRDLASQLATRAEEKVHLLRERINMLRQQEARQLETATSQEEHRTPSALRPEATLNTQLAQQSKELGESIAAATEELEQINLDLAKIEHDSESVHNKVDQVGLNEGIGMLLRRELTALADPRAHQRKLQDRRTLLRKVQLELIVLKDQRYELGDIERETDRKLKELGPLPSNVPREFLERALRELLETRKELLDKLIQSKDSYFDLLLQIDSSEDQLIQQMNSYSDYLREHVLWIRSGFFIRPDDISIAGDAARWLLSPSNWADAMWAVLPHGAHVQNMLKSESRYSWSEIASAVGGDVGRRPQILLSFLVFLVYIGVLGVNHRRLRAQIRDLGEVAARRNCQQFLPTFHALFTTVFTSLLWPSLLMFIAWRLTQTRIANEFVRAVGYGMGFAGIHFFSLEFLRQVCRPQGLGEAHFDWPDEAVGIIRKRIRTLLIVTLPLVFLAATLQNQTREPWQNSLGRMTFVVALIYFAFWSYRILHPNGMFIRRFRLTTPDSLIYRMRHIWYGSVLSALFAITLLALAGYYYTAYELTSRLQQTLWLLLTLLILASLIARWLLVNRRKLRIEQVRERRRAMQAQLDAAAEDVDSITTPPVTLVDELDLGELSQQGRQLLRVGLFVAGILGLWWIWVDVLPALGMLKHVRIWEVAVSDGTRWITLEHLVVCLMILVLTILAVRNLPGILELTVLQRLPFDAGARYAITTSLRYLLIILGIIFGFRTIGIEWSQYQWLVAAASVGLGFGLQEIFANFVSGLIVLVERPIRVGDIVTVEGVTGVVSRIRMRATTVTNWDRQEFIVPNKEFVAGRLLNWTLSNAVNRVVVKVGVAYGSDTELARQILTSVASDNEYIMDDPTPIVTFEGFGDSTLDFVLRCYLPNLENRLTTIHQLHTEIHTRFAEASLEIAFPQQDIHIRSLPPNHSIG